ncbi:MAG: hypothetical protein K2H13_05725 [Eubacterium sp.]|nr:hypothetical protein [Eubacterium sp.]
MAVLISNGDSSGILYSVSALLKFSVFYFIVFAFISYEFGCICKRSKIAECLKATKNGYSKFVFSQAVVLFCCVLVFFIVQLLCNLCLCIMDNEWHLQYLWHTFLGCVLSYFLTAFVGELFGLLLAQSANRLNSYLLLAFVSLLGTNMAENMVYALYSMRGINLYPLVNLFNLYPPSLNWTPVFAFGQSILPYRWATALFWMFLLTALLILKVSDKNKKQKAITAFFPAVLSVVCLIITLLPQSKLILNSYDPAASSMADYEYYVEGAAAEPVLYEEADFSIDKYDLELSFGLEMKAKAVLYADKKDLSEYKLTLYHGFKVDSVRDENNEKLEFEQDGDYLIIYNENKNLNSFTIKYHGHSNVCYSNVQGAFLPAYFPYYPRAGVELVFDGLEYSPMSKNTVSEFNVKINGIQKYYSNLEETDKNVFSGESNGLTIVSGMYDVFESDGLRLVYPYLKSDEFTKERIEDFIQQNKETAAINGNVKNIIFIPSYSNSTYTSYIDYSDYIVTTQILGFTERYEAQLTPSYKEDLKSVYQMYISAPELFSAMLEGAEGMTGPTIEVYIADYVDYIGEEKALANIEQYLNDNSDTRTYEEFFADEMGGTD